MVGAALGVHSSVVGPGGTWKTSFSTAQGRKRLAFWKGEHIRSGHDDLGFAVVKIARDLAFPATFTRLQPRTLDLLLAATRASTSYGYRVR